MKLPSGLKLKLSNRRAARFLLPILAVPLAFAWYYYARPAWENYQEVKQDALSLQEEVQSARECLARKNDIYSEIEELFNQRNSLDFSIPVREEIPQAFMALDNLLSRTNLEITTLNVGPLESGEEEGYYYIDIDLAVQGTRNAHLSLMQGIEDFPYLMVAKKLSWGEEGGGQQLSMALRLYVVEEEPLRNIDFDIPLRKTEKEDKEEKQKETNERFGKERNDKETNEKFEEKGGKEKEELGKEETEKDKYKAPLELGANFNLYSLFPHVECRWSRTAR